MAVISSPLSRTSSTIRGLSSSVSFIKKQIGATRNSISNINKVILKRRKIKSDIFNKTRTINERRAEASRRRDIEDAIEAGSVVARGIFSPIKIIAASSKGFLGRIIDFIGYLGIGWLVNNLPTWIGMAKEFIARLYVAGQIMNSLVFDTINIVKGFGNSLGAIFTNIKNFDFFDESKRVQTAFGELNQSIDDMRYQFDRAFKLFETPLGAGTYSGEMAPGLGTQAPAEQLSLGPSPIAGIHKQALDIIAGPESGGNYDAMNQGTVGNRIIGSGDSSKIVGKPLTSMTIGEVLQRQAYLMNKRNPQRSNYGIYAAGKYQMIPITLPGAMSAAGLKPSDLFSPQNQDRMGLAVLKSQGIGAWTAGGSRYSARERAIIQQAKTTPLPTFTPQAIKPQSTKGGKIIEYLTGDRAHKRYRADHAAGNYHDHVAFDRQETRDAAINWLRGKGWIVGSINTGRHAYGSYHYSNQAFDIPFYPNQSKKGVTDDARGETLLSSRLRSDLIAGGFNGPQLGGSTTPAQITARVPIAQPSSISPQRRGQDVIISMPSEPETSTVVYDGQQPMSSFIGPSENEVLNTFIKKKILLDLAYV